MAKTTKKEVKDETVPAKIGKKPKLFKLGESSADGMFFDTVSRKKVLPGQNIEFDAKAMSTEKFKAARRGGHLIEAGPGEEETELEETNPDLADFINAGDKEGKIAYIKDNYEVSEEDLASLEAMTDEELDAEFKKTYLED